MGTIAAGFASAFRDWITANVPASGEHEPVKSEVRALGPLIEAAIANITLAGLLDVVKDTRANLDADLAHAANSVALVYADATDANNDLYIKVGGSGSGSWTLTSILHDIVDTLAAPYATLALADRAIVSGEVRAMRLEADDALRIWAGAGLLFREGEDVTAIPAPGEQLIEDGFGYFYRLSASTFHYLDLTTAAPTWQSSGDYFLLFGNVGGRLVGPFADRRHVSGFHVEKTATEIDIWTPELAPLTNKHFRLRFAYETAGTRQDIWRWTTAHLVERTHTGYTDIEQAFTSADKEVLLTQQGKTVVGGSNGNHKIVGDALLFLDGRASYNDGGVTKLYIDDATGAWDVESVDVGQHTELLEQGSAGDGTRIALVSMRHSARMIDGAPAIAILADVETTEPISIASLYIGNSAPAWNVSGDGCFDTVYRGPQWWPERLDNASFTPFADLSTIVRYEGAGITIDPEGTPATVNGEGATCEVEIMPGSDWSDENRSTFISNDTYGRAEFKWMGEEYAAASPAGTTLRARMQWRFGFNGD